MITRCGNGEKEQGMKIMTRFGKDKKEHKKKMETMTRCWNGEKEHKIDDGYHDEMWEE